MSQQLLREIIALKSKIQALEALIAALEKAQSDPAGLAQLVADAVAEAIAPYEGMRAKVDELFDLRASILSDVELIVDDIRNRKPVKPGKAKPPRTLVKLGIVKEGEPVIPLADPEEEPATPAEEEQEHVSSE